MEAQRDIKKESPSKKYGSEFGDVRSIDNRSPSKSKKKAHFADDTNVYNVGIRSADITGLNKKGLTSKRRTKKLSPTSLKNKSMSIGGQNSSEGD